MVDGGGNLDTRVTIGGETASLALDLTPNDEVQPFHFEELLLQAGSFQPRDSFAKQFGDSGQQFTYLDGGVTSVPSPGTLALLLAGIVGIAGAAGARRSQ